MCLEKQTIVRINHWLTSHHILMSSVYPHDQSMALDILGTPNLLESSRHKFASPRFLRPARTVIWGVFMLDWIKMNDFVSNLYVCKSKIVDLPEHLLLHNLKAKCNIGYQVIHDGLTSSDYLLNYRLYIFSDWNANNQLFNHSCRQKWLSWHVWNDNRP